MHIQKLTYRLNGEKGKDMTYREIADSRERMGEIMAGVTVVRMMVLESEFSDRMPEWDEQAPDWVREAAGSC